MRQDQDELDRPIKRRRTSPASYAVIRRTQPQPPISSLPTEILLEIFRYLSSIPRKGATSKLWFAVTHVCQRWRDIATSNSTLWGTIVIRRRGLRRAMLAISRSGELPLDVLVTWSVQNHAEFYLHRYAVLDVAERIRTLDIEIPELDFGSLCVDPLSISAPHLRSVRHDGGQLGGLGVLECLDYPTLSNIERVEITPVDMLTPALLDVLQHLTSLKHLTIISTGPFQRPRLEDMLQVLESRPSLETLSVACNFSLDDHVSDRIPDSRRVALPNLRHLTLPEDVNDSSLLLHHLDLPPLTHIAIGTVTFPTDNIFSLYNSDAWRSLITTTFAHAVDASRPRHMLSVADIFESPYLADVRVACFGADEADPNPVWDTAAAPSHSMRVCLRDPLAYIDVLYKELLGTIDVLHLTDMRVNANRPPYTLLHLRDGCTNVQKISTNDLPPGDLSLLLTGIEGDNVPFHKLHTLAITSISCEPCSFDESDICECSKCFCSVASALRLRHEQGHAVSKLNIGVVMPPLPDRLIKEITPFVLEEITYVTLPSSKI